MDEVLWFKEPIFPLASRAEALAEGLKGLDAGDLAEAMGDDALADMSKAQRAAYVEGFTGQLRGAVSAYQPRARRVATAGEAGAMADSAALAQGDLYLVRLGVEFELEKLPQPYQKARCRFAKVWCRAFVSSSCAPPPRVLDIAPDQVYEGGPRFVRVEAKPALAWGDVEASLGSAATDVQIGRIGPATVGFLGPDEREPHWKVSEKERAIEGRYHFWLLLDAPPACDPASVRLGLLGEADVVASRMTLGLIPTSRVRSEAQVMTLARMLGG